MPEMTKSHAGKTRLMGLQMSLTCASPRLWSSFIAHAKFYSLFSFTHVITQAHAHMLCLCLSCTHVHTHTHTHNYILYE